MNLEIINPLEHENWDDLVLETEGYSIFHSSAWARVLYETYQYKPLYFTNSNQKKLSVVIPLMEVKSFFTGSRGVSLPFSDYCQPIVDEDIKIDDVLDEIIKFGEKSKWKHIEWRFGQKYLHNINPSKKYFGHVLNLNGDPDTIFSNLRSSTKRNIKKAIKQGVKCKIFHSLSAIEKFCHLNCMTRKHHGLPPQPWSFFKSIFEHVISEGKGFVVLASYKDELIAGAIYFFFGDKAIYKYGASDRKFQNLRPNNLVMWKAIEWTARNGYKKFNFGRTEPENDGLLQFKRGWRGEEENINYYRYDLQKKSYVNQQNAIKSSYNLFKMMPMPFLKFTGRLLYRHMG